MKNLEPSEEEKKSLDELLGIIPTAENLTEDEKIYITELNSMVSVMMTRVHAMLSSDDIAKRNRVIESFKRLEKENQKAMTVSSKNKDFKKTLYQSDLRTIAEMAYLIGYVEGSKDGERYAR